MPLIGREAKNVPVTARSTTLRAIPATMTFQGATACGARTRLLTTTGFANKGNDTFGPIGPCIVPRNRSPPTIRRYLSIKCLCQRRADDRTRIPRSMVWSVAELIANCSAITTLSPGDVIATRTGAVVGRQRHQGQSRRDR